MAITTKRSKRTRPSNNNNNNNNNNWNMMERETTGANTATNLYSTEMTYLSASANGMAVKRIRTPHAHDVLSGRGGGINSHIGNIQFREWVSVRKNDYNLAPNKTEKAQVARDVVALVKAQNPPGRFLQKEPSGMNTMGWWIELDDDKVMAKTAQALREGAPLIRAAHKDEIDEKRKEDVHRRSRKTEKSSTSTTTTTSNGSSAHHYSPTVVRQTRVPSHSMSPRIMLETLHTPLVVDPVVTLDSVQATPLDNSNSSSALNLEEMERAPKKVRVEYNGHALYPTDDTPPLLPIQPKPSMLLNLPTLDDHHFPPPALPSRSQFNSPDLVNGGNGVTGDGLKRAHSLAFSDTSLGDWEPDVFVNPFEDEVRHIESVRNASSSSSLSNGGARTPGGGGGVLVTRESTSSSSSGSHGDMGGISALLRQQSPTNNNNNNNNNMNDSRNYSLSRWQHHPSNDLTRSLGNSSASGIVNISPFGSTGLQRPSARN